MRTTIFSTTSPPANIYEFRLDNSGTVTPISPKEGRKNMENVNIDTIADQMALANDLDVEKLSDEDFEHLLAINPDKFTQDEEDTDPTINEHIRGESEEIEAVKSLDS